MAIAGDAVTEGNELFSVTLSNASGNVATGGDLTAFGTIVNDALYLEPDVAGEPGLPLPLKRAPSAPGDGRG